MKRAIWKFEVYDGAEVGIDLPGESVEDQAWREAEDEASHPGPAPT